MNIKLLSSLGGIELVLYSRSVCFQSR